ncbi:MAG: PD-(D/E)XK nuclease domain-containing protein [Lachnospiraceae bacterium]|nr:PD-(D/E)XK nuclease domain-containing protein [Lachnospiraceae bacterium]
MQWEELPCGEGDADIVYLPKHDSEWPVLVIELKWKDSAEGTISQILDRKYPESLEGFGSEIVLVGINYDKDAPGRDKKHSCKIIRMEK